MSLPRESNDGNGFADAGIGAAVAVRDLCVSYGSHDAVRNVSFDIAAGSTLALVGESGSGKSTIALACSRLLEPSAVVRGSIMVGGVDVLSLRGAPLRTMRGKKVAYLAQDALAALNPVVRIGRQVGEIFTVRGGDKPKVAWERAIAALERVNINDPGRVASMYPYQLSGGMRQRVMIAMALADEPELLIADEPTTALDVTVQADILNLILDIQQASGLTCLWITHDMSVVAHMADTVAVLYGGQLLEMSGVYSVFDNPRNPYTAKLLDCFSSGRTAGHKAPFNAIPGNPVGRAARSGCPFGPRCERAQDTCHLGAPVSIEIEPRHWVACHHPLELEASR